MYRVGADVLVYVHSRYAGVCTCSFRDSSITPVNYLQRPSPTVNTRP